MGINKAQKECFQKEVVQKDKLIKQLEAAIEAQKLDKLELETQIVEMQDVNKASVIDDHLELYTRFDKYVQSAELAHVQTTDKLGRLVDLMKFREAVQKYHSKKDQAIQTCIGSGVQSLDDESKGLVDKLK